MNKSLFIAARGRIRPRLIVNDNLLLWKMSTIHQEKNVSILHFFDKDKIEYSSRIF